MAAPTNVLAEGQSLSSILLYWTYSGTHWVGVYRSTDGSAYTEIAQVLATAGTYTDEDLSAGTKYYYKLTDDDGSTFSTAVSTYTHFCASQGAGQPFNLPRFDNGQEDQAANLNAMAERIEQALGDYVISPNTCVACPSDGAVAVDCRQGCESFLVVADQNITSFSVNNCGNETRPIDVYVPPGTTRTICGLPAGWGFTGNECTDAPISGGSKGKTLHLGSNAGWGPGSTSNGPPRRADLDVVHKGGASSGAGGGCECTPGRQNQLTLKCCNSNCSLRCGQAGNGGRLIVKACGGIAPYTFERTGNVSFEIKPDGTSVNEIVIPRSSASAQVTVVVPPNPGASVVGTAYQICHYGQSRAGPGCAGAAGVQLGGAGEYGCNDSLLSCNTSPSGCVAPSSVSSCVAGVGGCDLPPCVAPSDVCTESSWNTEPQSPVDKRTAGMISNGCSPCGLNAGAVITVTDASRVSVSVTLRK